MTSAPDAAAIPAEFLLGGKTWKMSPLTRADRAEFDRWLQQRVIAAARAGITPDMPIEEKREWMDAAMRQAQAISMSTREGMDHIATEDGIARLAWLGMRHHHQGLTVDQVADMIDAKAIETVMDVWDLLNLSHVQKKNVAEESPPDPATKA